MKNSNFTFEAECYENMNEEEIVKIAQNGDLKAEEYLIKRYKNFVKAKARSYYLIGADREDIIQEGTIGFYKAIRDYNANKEVTFRVFAKLCVTRQMITAIKTATRQKHIPLNSYISLNKPMYNEENDKTLLDILAGEKINNPEDLLISKEEIINIESKIKEHLSKLEIKVLNSYLQGKSYIEISDEINKSIKSIDNALQRVKRKLEKFILPL